MVGKMQGADLSPREYQLVKGAVEHGVMDSVGGYFCLGGHGDIRVRYGSRTLSSLEKRGLVQYDHYWRGTDAGKQAVDHYEERLRTKGAMLPLNGTKTHPLSAHAIDVLRRLVQRGPMPILEVNPGLRNRLERDALICRVLMPSPYKTHKGKNIEFAQATEAGRAELEKRDNHA